MLFGYNGNPYVTLTLALEALITHNNIVFFSKNYYAINSSIIQVLNKICQKLNYAQMPLLVEYDDIEEIVQNQSLFDLVIYVGDKREFIPLKKRLVIPTIFNGYGYIDVFVESKDYKDILLDIENYSIKNNVVINYFDNTSYEETINYINKYEITDCFVLFSKNTDLIYKFMSQMRVKNFYINKNPFENYEFRLDEKKLTYNKKIFMKKM